MTRIMKNQPVSITPHALESATLHCIAEKSANREACGFIVGRDGVGERAIRLVNHHEDQASNYRMADAAVVGVFNEVDETGEDVVAHYHSHPSGEAIPSDDDLQVRDHSHAYVIIGFDNNQPRAKAYRMDLEAIGVPRATEVLIHLSEDGLPYTPAPPKVAWSLTEGNTVRLGYVRHGHVQKRSVVAVISRATPTTVYLTPERPGRNIPQSLPISRIQSAEVLKESALAKQLRQRTITQARRLVQLLAQGPGQDVAEIVEILAAAYPINLGRSAGPSTPDDPQDRAVSVKPVKATGILARPVIIG